MSDINTQFQGAYLFSGSNVTVAPYAISGGTVSAYQGDTDTNQIDIGTGRVSGEHVRWRRHFSGG